MSKCVEIRTLSFLFRMKSPSCVSLIYEVGLLSTWHSRPLFVWSLPKCRCSLGLPARRFCHKLWPGTCCNGADRLPSRFAHNYRTVERICSWHWSLPPHISRFFIFLSLGQGWIIICTRCQMGQFRSSRGPYRMLLKRCVCVYHISKWILQIWHKAE